MAALDLKKGVMMSHTAPNDSFTSPLRSGRRNVQAMMGPRAGTSPRSVERSHATATTMLTLSSYRAHEEFESVVDTQSSFSLKIKQKRAVLDEINATIQRLKGEIDAQRKPSKEPYDGLVSNLKRRRLLHHELQTVTMRLCQANNENTCLKRQVDELRLEKLSQKNRHKQLEADLNAKRKELKELMLTTQDVHTQKEDHKRTLETLKDEACSKVANFTNQFDAMKSMTTYDMSKSATTLLTLTVNPDAKKTTVDSSKSKLKLEKLKSGVGKDLGELITVDENNIVDPEVDRIKDENQKSFWMIRDRSNVVGKQEEKIKELTAIFNHIEGETNVPAENMVATLEESDSRAFQLFRLVHDLNQEEEQCTEEKNNLERDLSQAQSKKIQRLQHRTQIKADLEKQISVLKKQAEDFEGSATTDSKALEDILTLLVGVFMKLGCKDTPEGQHLSNVGINIHNLPNVLSVMESQLDTMLQICACAASGGKTLKATDVITDDSLKKGPVAIKVPSTNDFEDDIDDNSASGEPRFQRTADLRKTLGAKLQMKNRKFGKFLSPTGLA